MAQRPPNLPSEARFLGAVRGEFRYLIPSLNEIWIYTAIRRPGGVEWSRPRRFRARALAGCGACS